MVRREVGQSIAHAVWEWAPWLARKLDAAIHESNMRVAGSDNDRRVQGLIMTNTGRERLAKAMVGDLGSAPWGRVTDGRD